MLAEWTRFRKVTPLQETAEIQSSGVPQVLDHILLQPAAPCRRLWVCLPLSRVSGQRKRAHVHV